MVSRETRTDQRQPTTVQTLIFDKEFWTRQRAVAWAKDHEFKSSSVDETETSFRLRQRPPGDFKPESFRVIDFEGVRGIQSVIGRLK